MGCIPICCELCSGRGECIDEAGKKLCMEPKEMAKQWESDSHSQKFAKFLPTEMSAEDKALAFIWNLDWDSPAFKGMLMKVNSGGCKFDVDEARDQALKTHKSEPVIRKPIQPRRQFFQAMTWQAQFQPQAAF